MPFFTPLIPDLAERAAAQHVDLTYVDDEVLQEFWSFMGEANEDLAAQLGSEDFSSAAKTIHAVKGTGTSVGFPELSIAAAELELAVKAADTERAEALSQAIREWTRAHTSIGG